MLRFGSSRVAGKAIRILDREGKEQYLQENIKNGGSKIKFVTGRQGIGKTHFLRFSAKAVWLHDFKEIYVEILRQCDIMDCLENVSHHLIQQMGYHGWVILVDETELMGRLGKKARLNAYRNMADFLLPDRCSEATFSIFALSASYVEDVIEGKHEYENLEEVYPEEQEPARSVLDLLTRAPQLLPLTKEEINEVLCRIQDFHGKAYGWTPNLSASALAASTQSGGYLLRTKIRAAIEFLDQLYQYGKAGKTTINELGEETFEEDVPLIEEF